VAGVQHAAEIVILLGYALDIVDITLFHRAPLVLS